MNGWIRTDESLPEDHNPRNLKQIKVLVAFWSNGHLDTRTEARRLVGYGQNSHWVFTHDDDVIFWMFPPEPPKFSKQDYEAYRHKRYRELYPDKKEDQP